MELTTQRIAGRFVVTFEKIQPSEEWNQSWLQNHKSSNCFFPPPRVDAVRKAASEWQVYRTRFLIRAKQLTEPLVFVDALGREHRGQEGDYLVESSDGARRIAPREIFEDVYVAMGPAGDANGPWLSRRRISIPDLKDRASPGTVIP